MGWSDSIPELSLPTGNKQIVTYILSTYMLDTKIIRNNIAEDLSLDC